VRMERGKRESCELRSLVKGERPLQRPLQRSVLVLGMAFVAACSSDKSPAGPKVSSFLQGANGNPQIGVVVNSTGGALTLFQLGAPHGAQETVAFGASALVTPVGFSLQGTTAVVPLGNTGSTAIVDLNALKVTRYMLFAGGNATGQAFVDDSTVIVGNETLNYVGRFTTTQTSDTVGQTAAVAPAPSDIEAANGNAYVISANLDANSNPLGNGIVTKVNGKTLAVLDTGITGGTNSSAAAVGPDGRLYVVNTGDYTTQSTVTVMDTATLAVLNTYPNFGIGAGAITIDANGLAYVSSFYSGTVIWNTTTQSFVGSGLCVMAGGSCVGAFSAATDAAGDVYQVFFGSPPSTAGTVYVYTHGTYAVSDSINVGQGPTLIRIATF
jgi:hypothetical protein